MPTPTFPTYLWNDLQTVVQYAGEHAFKANVPPTLTAAETLDFFVAKEDHQICRRARQIYGATKVNRCYTVYTETPSGQTIAHACNVDPHGDIAFPDGPTKDNDISHPFYQALVERGNELEDTHRRWINVAGMVEAFHMSNQSWGVVKGLWPDFDMLFKIKQIAGVSYKSKDWVTKFEQIGKARNFTFPVPDCMDHLEEIRRTVLTAMLLPAAYEHPREHVLVTSCLKSHAEYETAWGVKRKGLFSRYL